MSASAQSTSQKFPFPRDACFDALLQVLPENRFAIKSEDRVIGRITVSAGMSMLSWGENVAVKLEAIDAKNTEVTIESALVLGMNLAGGHRHAKNFEIIIAALSRRLQALDAPPPPAVPLPEPDPFVLEGHNVLIFIGALVILAAFVIRYALAPSRAG